MAGAAAQYGTGAPEPQVSGRGSGAPPRKEHSKRAHAQSHRSNTTRSDTKRHRCRADARAGPRAGPAQSSLQKKARPQHPNTNRMCRCRARAGPTQNSTIKLKNIQRQGNQNYSSDGSSTERFQQANHTIIPKLQKEGNRYSSTQLISNASTKNIKPPSLPLSNNKQSANYIAIDESHQ